MSDSVNSLVCARGQFTRFRTKSFILSLSFIGLIVCELPLADSVTYFAYYDELLTLIFSAVLFANRHALICEDIQILSCLAVMVILGFASNLWSEIERGTYSVLVDALVFVKVFACCLGVKYSLRDHEVRSQVLCLLGFMARLFLVTEFVCACISIGFDIGMTSSQERFGFGCFSFVFSNASHCGLFTFGCLFIVLMGDLPKKKLLYYEVISMVSLALTLKGMSLVLVATYLFLRTFMRSNDNAGFGTYAILIALLSIVGSYQIQTYILNPTAPRAMLLRYGFITGARFFPFGSGFATYGSNEAAMHYSPLYTEYGFSNRRALSILEGPEMYLNDCYLGMVVGQFGFLGLIVFVALIYKLSRQLTWPNALGFESRQAAYSAFICLLIISLASGTFKAIPGVFLFMTLGIYLSAAFQVENSLSLERSRYHRYYIER